MEVLLGLLIVIAVLLFIGHRRMAPHRGDMTPEEAQRDWGSWGSSGGGALG
jgi:hypothetical protein